MFCVFFLEDWIVLVKVVVVVVVKNKIGNKFRISVNSNKDKEREERKWFKVFLKKEEILVFIVILEVEKKEGLFIFSEIFGIEFVFAFIFYGSVEFM